MFRSGLLVAADPVRSTVCRQGWRYFDTARRFHNLYPSAYTMDDAISELFLFFLYGPLTIQLVFLLMSSYLMNSSLPSPTWMMIGATCRIFQDLGLHKLPPESHNSRINQECRNRLFWTAYLLDRQSSIAFGRPCILQDSDISVKLPGEIEVSGVDASESDSGGHTNCEFGDYQSDRLIHSGGLALASYRSLIETSKYFEQIRQFRLVENGSDNDIMRMRELDSKLERVWESFPNELTNLDTSLGLEPCALRPLFDLQHARLLLYRCFADFSQPLRASCRTYCLSQSISVCRATAGLLLRSSLVRDWETNLALRSSETVRVHIFRAGAILLLGYNLRDPGIDRVEREEVSITLRSLKAVAMRKSMRKPYQLIQMAARMFGFVPDFSMEIPYNLDETVNVVEAQPKPELMDWRGSQSREDTSRLSQEQTHAHQPTTVTDQSQEMPYREKGGNGDHPQYGSSTSPTKQPQPPLQQPIHCHMFHSSSNTKGPLPHQNIPPHQYGESHVSAMVPHSILPPNPPHPNHPYGPELNPSIEMSILNAPTMNTSASLNEVDSQMNAHPLLFGSESGLLNWNAFESMVNSSAEYSHLGFGDLLARGPDLGWGYPLFSHNTSEVVEGLESATSPLYNIGHEMETTEGGSAQGHRALAQAGAATGQEREGEPGRERGEEGR